MENIYLPEIHTDKWAHRQPLFKHTACRLKRQCWKWAENRMVTTIVTAWGVHRNTPATADCWHTNTRGWVGWKDRSDFLDFSDYLEKHRKGFLTDTNGWADTELLSDVSDKAVNEWRELMLRHSVGSWLLLKFWPLFPETPVTGLARRIFLTALLLTLQYIYNWKAS